MAVLVIKGNNKALREQQCQFKLTKCLISLCAHYRLQNIWIGLKLKVYG